MNCRTLQTILAATMLGMALSATAQTTSYPITSRSGTTTVTGVYRPLDLHLQFDDIAVANSEFFYVPSATPGQTFALTSQLTGTFSSSYGASGTAGSWTLNLGFNAFNTSNNIVDSGAILDTNVRDSNDGEDTITLGITAANRPVGTLVYNSGLSATSGSLPMDGSDTPVDGDMFLLYAHNAGAVFRVTVDDIANPTNFYLALAQELLHVGPYVSVGTNLYDLDDGTIDGRTLTRLNADCEQGTGRCGSVPVNGFFASSVAGATFIPEPGSLALVGLGLVAVAWGRRSRQARLGAR